MLVIAPVIVSGGQHRQLPALPEQGAQGLNPEPQAVGGFRTTMERGLEDYDFWLSILELGRKIYQLPDTLFHYRIKSGSRTSQFMENPQVIKDTYREIYHNHPALYDRYREEYVTALRNELVDQICINRTYQKAIGILQKVKQIPLVRQLLRRWFLK